MEVLIIEDDKEIADFISQSLEKSKHDSEVAYDGNSGLEKALNNKYDVLIVDRMLPEIEGLEIIKKLREKNITTPVLILSALGETDDRVKGLKSGGDDYLVKPFAFEELLARIEALVRREAMKNNVQTEIEVHGLTLDLLKRTAIRDNEEIELNGKEFKLLEYLLRNQGQNITRTMILENVWNYHFDPQTNIIDVHISRLRQKLGKIDGQPFIRTVRGSGYTIAADE